MERHRTLVEFLKPKVLPKCAVPKHYTLNLKVDLTGNIFTGTVSIVLGIVEATFNIVFNSVDLQLSNVSIRTSEEIFYPAEVITLPETETVELHFDKNLPLGTYLLKITFQGALREQPMQGFFRTNPTEDTMVLTQFFGSHARRCFPCWDEPEFKAVFVISITIPSKFLVISCTPQTEERFKKDAKECQFEKTPKISPHLVSIVIGKFDFIQETIFDGIIRIFAPKGKKEQTRFAMELVKKIIPFFRAYFKVPFPTDKIDFVPVPGYIYHSTSYWGIVICREANLLLDQKTHHPLHQQSMTLQLSQALCRQWYGNFVTMRKWSDAWLFEGLSIYFKWLFTDFLYPQLHMWPQFMVRELVPILDFDCMRTSHTIAKAYHTIVKSSHTTIVKPGRVTLISPSTVKHSNHSSTSDTIHSTPSKVQSPVTKPQSSRFSFKSTWANILPMLKKHSSSANSPRASISHPLEDEGFDRLSFLKSAMLIKMLNTHLGDSAFKSCMNAFFIKYMYGLVEPKDWIECFETANCKRVASVIENWTMKVGYPLVKFTCVRKKKKWTLTFSQDNFQLHSTKPYDYYLWMIPLYVSTLSAPGKIVSSTVMEHRHHTVEVKGMDKDEVFYVQCGIVGFRVQYAPTILKMFVDNIRTNRFPLLDTLGLLSDTYAVVKVGKQDIKYFLEFLQAFTEHSDYSVWYLICRSLQEIHVLVYESEVEEKYLVFVRKLLSRIFQVVGWVMSPNEFHPNAALREVIIKTLALSRDRLVENYTADRLEHYLHGGFGLGCLKLPVFIGGLKKHPELANELLRVHDEGVNPTEKEAICKAIGVVGDEAILEKVLDMAFCKKFGNRNSMHVIAGVIKYSRAGYKLAWTLFKERWMSLFQEYEEFYVFYILTILAANTISDSVADEMEEFLEKGKLFTDRTRKEIVEQSRLHALFYNKSIHSIKVFFEGHSKEK